jgi:hypothetical protein
MQQCFYEPCPMTPAVSTSPLTPKIQLPILEPFFKLRISLRVFIGLQLLVLWIWKMKKTHKRKGGMWKEGGRDRKGGIYCLNVLSKTFRPPADAARPAPARRQGTWSCHYTVVRGLRAGSDYAQVERRSVTFLDQSMSRGEAFGLKKYMKIIHC